MPLNPHLIAPKPRDMGTATAVAELRRRIRGLEGHYGVVGSVILSSTPGGPTTGVIDSSAVGATDNTVEVLGQSTNASVIVTLKLTADSTGPVRDATLVTSVSGTPQTTTLVTGAAGNGVWNGSLSASSFITVSDESIKQDIQDIGDHSALYNLRPVSYVDKRSGETHLGFVAQEVRGHVPQAVKEVRHAGEDKGILGINMNAVLALLVAGAQRHEDRLATLERKIDGA